MASSAVTRSYRTIAISMWMSPCCRSAGVGMGTLLGGALGSCGRSGGRARIARAAVEAAPILRGAHCEGAQEHAAHRLRARKAAGGCDGGDRLGRLLQLPAGGLQAHALDVAPGRDTRLGAERAGEVPRAHVRASGHGLDGVGLGDALEYLPLA